MNSGLSSSLKTWIRLFLETPESLAWPEKRTLAEAILRERRDLGIPEGLNELRQAVRQLASDVKWEIRLVAAQILPLLPDDDYQALASALTADENAYVKRTAERSLGQRRQAAREVRKTRKAANQIDEMLDGMERQFGRIAAGRARKICDRHAAILIGTIAHDLRNILTSLKSGVTAHLSRCGKTPVAKSKTPSRILSDMDLLESMVADMGRYGQELPIEMTMEDLPAVLRAGSEMARSALQERGCNIEPVSILIETEVDLRVEMVRRLIVLAVSHVVKNAIESFLQSDGAFSSGQVNIRAWAQDRQVTIDIVNNGPGLDENDLAVLRSFLPGRKNKMKETSRGYGLPTAYRYMLHHGGTVDIDSPGGEGAVITLRLPISQDLRIDI